MTFRFSRFAVLSVALSTLAFAGLSAWAQEGHGDFAFTTQEGLPMTDGEVESSIQRIDILDSSRTYFGPSSPRVSGLSNGFRLSLASAARLEAEFGPMVQSLISNPDAFRADPMPQIRRINEMFNRYERILLDVKREMTAQNLRTLQVVVRAADGSSQRTLVNAEVIDMNLRLINLYRNQLVPNMSEIILGRASQENYRALQSAQQNIQTLAPAMMERMQALITEFERYAPGAH